MGLQLNKFASNISPSSWLDISVLAMSQPLQIGGTVIAWIVIYVIYVITISPSSLLPRAGRKERFGHHLVDSFGFDFPIARQDNMQISGL
jgi:hypothetical protein